MKNLFSDKQAGIICRRRWRGVRDGLGGCVKGEEGDRRMGGSKLGHVERVCTFEYIVTKRSYRGEMEGNPYQSPGS